MLPPKRFKQNTTKATEIKRNGTEAIGIDQDGIAKSIDIEVLMNKDNVGLGDVDNTSDADKPVSTAQQAELDLKIPLAQKGQASGVATLGADGLVPSAQLPSYVDDVLEYDSLSLLPETGEASKIYVTLDTNLTYRWSGSGYTEISKSLALGETEATAYRGDRGKTAYDHTLLADNPHSVTKEQVGLGNADNTSDADKPVSMAQGIALALKVDKVSGKELSTNDYTTNEKNKLAGIEEGAKVNTVDSVAGKTGAVVLAKADVGLSNVANKTEAEMVADGAIKDALALKETVLNVDTLKGTDWAGETVKGNADDIATLNDDATTEGSVLKSIKEQAQKGDFAPTVASGIESETLEEAVNEVGVDVEAVKGTDWTDETVKGNAEDIATLNADDATEGSVAKTVKDAVEPIIEDVSDHESRIELLESVSPLTSWDDIQKVAKAGAARKYLKAGDLIETTYSGNPAVVEVVGINQDTPPEGTENYQDVISFHFKDCLQNAQYSAPQALFNAVEGLSAGTYTFINSYTSLPCTFTLTQAVPVSGVIVITSWGEPYNPLGIKTMQADRLTDIETGVAVTQASDGTALAPVNLTPRCRYGANLYIESGIRHFLNDNSESYLWVAQGLYDMPSTYGAGGGFLKRLDADFASVIGPVVKKVARATVDGDGQDTTEDKVWLLSRVEMGYGTEGVTKGEQVYERWNGATNAERIKLLSGSPRHWWLRPPNVSTQNYARSVVTDGTLYGNYSYGSVGLAPGLAVY